MKDEVKEQKVNEDCKCENGSCENCESCQNCEDCKNGKCKHEQQESEEHKASSNKNQINQSAEIEKLTANNADLNNKLMRVLADYANMQRDNEKRLEITLNQLKAKTANEIIGVLDDVNFALQAKEKMQLDEKVQTWVDGLLSTLKKLNKSLDVLGIVPMNVQAGEAFDSSRHEALGIVYEGIPDTLQTVVQDGYVMSGTEIIVRPARVIVNKNQASSIKN